MRSEEIYHCFLIWQLQVLSDVSLESPQSASTCELVVTGEENTGLPPFNCKQINLAVTKHTMLYHHHQPKDPGKNKTPDKVQMIAEHRLMMM